MSIKEQHPATLANSADSIAFIANELSKFTSVKYLDDLGLSDGLLSGSIKSAAVIACPDMGYSVPYVCSAPKAQLFLFQNYGHAFASGGLVETIVESGVNCLVVYGHSVCEFTKFLARAACDYTASSSTLPSERQLQNRLYADALQSNSETLWERVGQFNVLFELRRMLAHPVVGPIAARGGIKIHGWFHNSAHNQLEVFDPKQKEFTVPDNRASVLI